jgi:prepilin-type N-terminal cleavage/methylation domain-containing protein
VNLERKRAFSLIELIIVLGLMAALAGIFASNFHGIDFGPWDDVSSFNGAIKRARNFSIATGQPIILSCIPGKFLILDTFGKKLSELECNLCGDTVNPLSKCVAKFDEFGFFTKFTVKCAGIEYLPDILSGILREKEK